MSDGMECEKNERLTPREIEEEEMKRELTGIGIYEPGISYKEMKRLLEFVNESQDTSNVAPNNKNAQEGTQHSDNECLSDVTSNVSAQQEVTLQECTETPRPSYSYKLNRTSPTMHERKAQYISTAESPSLFEARNPAYRRKSSDSDELFDIANSTHSTNRFPSLRLSKASRESQSAAEKRTAQDEVVQKLERWRLNPLDVCVDVKDVPLRQPARPSARERAPFEHCKGAAHAPSEQRDQVIRSMSQHLKELADLWCTWRPNTDSIFQWGSPIQVGPANGSLDKRPLTETKTEQTKATEFTYRDGYDRACKRKANTVLASLKRDTSSEDEGDDRHDFVRVKKKKTKSDRSNSAESAAGQNAHASHKKASSNVIAGHSIDDNGDMEINERVELDCKRRADEKDERASPDLTVYPRRIVPPNPKARLCLSRQRKSNATSKAAPKTRRANENKIAEQAKDPKKDNAMTEEEIRRTLEDDWNDEGDGVAVEKDVEIHPLPISRDLRSRLRQKQLLPISKTKTAKETTRGATANNGEESDEEQNKKKRLKVAEQQKEELCEAQSRNGNWEQLMSDDEDKSSEMNRGFDAQNGNQSDVATSANNVSCPICNKLFPHNEIENHAADCDQFETNNEKDESNESQMLECNICNKYKSSDGVEYQEHVQHCISNRVNQKHSHGSEDTDTTSTSSFRNFKPISEQVDSEVDYLGQFPSNSKRNVNTGRKRKR